MSTPRPIQRLYAAVVARGISNARACRALRISERTGLRWQRAPWYDAAVGDELERLRGEILGNLGTLVPMAVAAYKRAMASDGPMGADLARDVLNWVYGPPDGR